MNASEDAWVSTTSLNFSRRDSAEMEDRNRSTNSSRVASAQECPSDDADFMLIWDCRRLLSIWEEFAAGLRRIFT